MDRRWLVVMASSVVLLASCGGDAASSTSERDRAAAVEANEELLERLPSLPGATVARPEGAGPPVGGHGLMSTAIYSLPSPGEPGAIVRQFAAELSGWTVICSRETPMRMSLDLRRGPAWLALSSSNSSGVTGSARELVAAVNALDGHVMQREYVARQPCDETSDR